MANVTGNTSKHWQKEIKINDTKHDLINVEQHVSLK
jgi:hypothetical protein